MPYLTQPVIFTARPGEGSGGQTKMPAVVTRVVEGDLVNVLIFPDGADPVFRNGVRLKGDDDFNCWEPVTTPEVEALTKRVASLEARLPKKKD